MQQLLFMGALPSTLSSRAKPRDLRFSGPFVEMFFDRAYPDFLLRRPHQRPCVRLSVRESRMKVANAPNLDRKSGEGEWRDLRFLLNPFDALH
jgi:hypothetical protein